jgi:recombination protein RecA
MPASSVADLRYKIESDLRGRVAAPFNYRDRSTLDLVSTGISEMDARVGGLPRGALTEICGRACSGRMSVLLAALAARTADGEACALVDARDSFDPATACAAGVQLERLLWVRCQNIDQALHATDLLIQGGGFGIVAVDLSDVSARLARQVPLHVWFRFRRAVEDTTTILLLLERETNAKTCASLVLRLEAGPPQWSEMETTQSGDATAKNEKSAITCPHARLFRGFEICSEVVRSRIQMETDCNSVNSFAETSGKKTPVILKTGDEHTRSKIPAQPERIFTLEPILTNAVFTT